VRRVSFETYQSDGCWWAKLIEHGRPVAEGALPNLAQAMFWSGTTEQQAIDKAKAFVRNAVLQFEAASE
jgi:hypothetical protein